MESPLRILLIEDDLLDATLFTHAIKREGLRSQIRRVMSATELQEAITGFIPQVIVCDFSLPGFNGFEALELRGLSALRRHSSFHLALSDESASNWP